jgi:hypothetical protein
MAIRHVLQHPGNDVACFAVGPEVTFCSDAFQAQQKTGIDN